jgi:hypothetical protein
LPPFLPKTVRTLAAARLRLSVSTSTIRPDAAGAEALVADLLVVFALARRALLDGAVDVVLGHAFRPGVGDGEPQAGVHGRVGQPDLAPR